MSVCVLRVHSSARVYSCYGLAGGKLSSLNAMRESSGSTESHFIKCARKGQGCQVKLSLFLVMLSLLGRCRPTSALPTWGSGKRRRGGSGEARRGGVIGG